MDASFLNSLGKAEARAMLHSCCGSQRWADAMVARRPFNGEEDLLSAVNAEYDKLAPNDWLECFAHHPEIGDAKALKAKLSASGAWAKGEQSGVQSASDQVIHALAQANKDYKQKFGFIFIVCATGKSAEEMLDLLKQRLNNDKDSELRIAAEENRKITIIRLEKLCKEVQSQPTS